MLQPELTPMQQRMMDAIDRNPDLDFDGRVLMYVIASHADEEGKAEISVEQLANEAPRWIVRAQIAEIMQ